RFILAVNTTASDAAIRKIASEDVGEDVSGLQILRVESIINTRGFGDGRCQEFVDRRSQVRVSLGKLVFDQQGQAVGIERGKGVFVDCHNPWRLVPPPEPCPITPRPSGGKFIWDPVACEWYKPAQSFDEQQNQSAVSQNPQDND